MGFFMGVFMRCIWWLLLVAASATPLHAGAGDNAKRPDPIEVSASVDLGGMTMSLAESVALERLYQAAAAALPKAAIIDHTVRDGSDRMEVAFLGASGIELSNLRFNRTINAEGLVVVEAKATVVHDPSLAEKQLELYYNNDAAKREVARLARELDEKQRQIDSLLQSKQGIETARLEQPSQLIADIQAIRKRQVVGAITTTTGTIGAAVALDQNARNAVLWDEAALQASALAQRISGASVEYLESCSGTDGDDALRGLIAGRQLSCDQAILNNVKLMVAQQLYGAHMRKADVSELPLRLVYQGRTFADVIAWVRYPPTTVASARERLMNPRLINDNKGALFSPPHYYDLAAFASPVDHPRCDDLPVNEPSCQQAYHPVARLLLARMAHALVEGEGQGRADCPFMAGIVPVGGMNALRGNSSSCAKAMTTTFGGFEIELLGAGDGESTTSFYYPLAFLSVFNPERVSSNHAAGEWPTKILGSFLLKPMEISLPKAIANAHSARLMVVKPTFQ